MICYLVIDVRTRAAQAVEIEKAAAICALHQNDILTALEEHGICETDTHTICEILIDALG